MAIVDPLEIEFKKDLAELGERDPLLLNKAWSSFVEKWAPRLPNKKVLVWDAEAARPVWVKKPVAPDYWTRLGVPDTVSFERLKGTLKKLKASGRSVRNMPTSAQEFTVLQMAYADTQKGVVAADRALCFLIEAGVDASFYNHTTSVLSDMALKGDWERIHQLYRRGQDLEVRVKPGVPTRPMFQGSTFLHRVGPMLMRRAFEAEKTTPGEENRFKTCLEKIYAWVPDCDALDAEGLTPLHRIEALMGKYLDHPLYRQLRDAALLRRGQALGMSLGLNPEDKDHQAWVNNSISWLVTGNEQGGAWPLTVARPDPMAFVEVPDQSTAFPKAYRRAQPGEGPRVLLRVADPAVVGFGEIKTPADVLRVAKKSSADGVLDGPADSPHALWWVLRPEQVRPYFAFEHVPAPRVNRGLRF